MSLCRRVPLNRGLSWTVWRSIVLRLLAAAGLMVFSLVTTAQSISLRGTATANGNNSSMQITEPGVAAANDLLLVQVAVRGTVTCGSIGVPVGWTLVTCNAISGTLVQGIYRKIATSADLAQSFAWSFASNRFAGSMLIYRGVDTSSPVDAFGDITNAASTTATAPSVTTTVANDIVVALFSAARGGTTITPGGSLTGETGNIDSAAGPNGVTAKAADMTKALVGATGAQTATLGHSLQSIGALVALKPAPPANCTSNVATGNWNVAGSWTNCRGGVPLAGDTVTINNGHAITLNTNPPSLSLLTNNGTLTDGGSIRTLTMAGPVVNAGTLNLSNSSIQIASSATWSGEGTWNLGTIDFNWLKQALTLASGASFTLNLYGTTPINNLNTGQGSFNAGGTNTTATVNFVRAGDQTIRSEAIVYPNLTLSGSGNKTPDVWATLDIRGNLTVGSGVSYRGDTGSGNVDLYGNLVNGGTFNSGWGTFTMRGTSGQSITGTTAFLTLKINNANGVTLNSDVTLSNFGTLTFTSGNIITGSSSFILAGFCNGGYTLNRTSGFVQGNLSLSFPGYAVACTYTVGDSVGYAPITVDKSGTNAGTLIGRADGGDHPDGSAAVKIDQSKNANHYWTLSAGSLSSATPYTAKFQFCATGFCSVPLEVDLGAATGNFIVAKKSGSWANQTVGTKTAISTQATGLTGFGVFEVGEAYAIPTVSIANASMIEGNSGSSTMNFVVTLSSTWSQNITVNFATSAITATAGSACGAGGTDYVTTSGTLTLLAGSLSTTIPVTVCGDTNYEGDETFTVTLSSPVNATLATAIATGTILNDDAPALVAEYHFDEATWNGTANEVKDSSGNAYHATAALAVTGSGLPGPAYSLTGQSTCGFGVFDGGSISKSYVQLPSGFPALSGSFSLTTWINSTDVTAQHQRIFVRDDASDGWALSLADGTGTGILRFFNRKVTFNSPSGGVISAGGVAIDTTFRLSNNTWYFVALTVDTVGKTAVMYAYDTSGVQRSKMSASFTGTWGAGTGATSIGGETSASSEGQQTSWHFLGRIDEVRIYSGALTQTLVEALLPTRRSCSAGPDHYELSLPTSSIACLATTATVTACADSSSPCTNKSTDVSGKTATLATNGGALAATTLTFDATGVASTTLSYPAAADATEVSVTLSGEQVAATNARQCCPNGTSCSVANSCATIFNTAGFIISATAAGEVATIPSQTAGTGSSTYYLRAVKSTTTTEACTTALTGATTVNWAYQCNNPTTCSASNLMSINGGTATTIARNDNASVSSYTSVPMTFDAGGSAPFTFNFSDVGETTLWVAKTVNSAPLSGSSKAFVTKPGGFLISDIKQTATPFLSNPAAAAATDAKFVKAGESFTATVTATASGGGTTPNYGRETSPEGVKLTRTLVLPSGGSAGTLSNGAMAGGSFSSGVASVANLAWDEVGIITMTPSVADGDYLGAGNVSGAVSGNIGRFYPHHFDTQVTQPGTTFTYSGQPFTTKVTAMNSSPALTTNYNATAGFSKDVTLSAWDSTGVTQNPGPGTLTPAQPPAVMLAGAFISTTTAAATVATPAYTFTTAKTAPRTIRVRATDSDSVSSSDGVTEGTALIRTGRLRLSNAFGSEKSNLTLAVAAEYWTGQSWLLNTDDSLSLIPTTAVALTPSGVAGSTVLSNVTLDFGRGSIVLVKPTSGTGMVDLAINLGSGTADLSCLATHPATTGAALPWLRSLNGKCAATYDRDPSARGSFGIYAPETKKTIHVRELY